MPTTASDIILSLFVFSVYFITKWMIYSLWCAKGIAYLKLTFNTLSLRNLILFFGLLRTFIGVLFGMIFYLIVGKEGNSIENLIPHTIPLAFLLITIRWLEWSIMDFIMNKATRMSLFTFLFGPNNLSRIWRLLGILISFVADGIFVGITFVFGFMALASGLFGRMC